jgi:hypothetical protein
MIALIWFALAVLASPFALDGLEGEIKSFN